MAIYYIGPLGLTEGLAKSIKTARARAYDFAYMTPNKQFFVYDRRPETLERWEIGYAVIGTAMMPDKKRKGDVYWIDYETSNNYILYPDGSLKRIR